MDCQFMLYANRDLDAKIRRQQMPMSGKEEYKEDAITDLLTFFLRRVHWLPTVVTVL